jgi:8-oxo-dGTP diphosphatase
MIKRNFGPTMRRHINAELRKIRAQDAMEAAHLADAIAWVESGAPLFRRIKPAIPPKHLVCYFAVVDGANILLVDHKNAQLWLPPGGHVETDEHPRATVVREIKEELDITLALEAIGLPAMLTVTQTVGTSLAHTDVTLWYVVQGDRFAPIQFDHSEFNEVRWFAFSEIPLARSEPHLKRFLTKIADSQTPTIR